MDTQISSSMHLQLNYVAVHSHKPAKEHTIKSIVSLPVLLGTMQARSRQSHLSIVAWQSLTHLGQM